MSHCQGNTELETSCWMNCHGFHALKAEFLKFSLLHQFPDCHYTPSGHHGIKQTLHGRLVYIYTVKGKLW